MNHLNDFKVKIAGVKFDFEKDWCGFRKQGLERGRSQNKSNRNQSKDDVFVYQVKFRAECRVEYQVRRSHRLRRRRGAEFQVEFQVEFRGGVVNPKDEGDTIQPMSVSLRPKILYREKAQYTREAQIKDRRHGCPQRRFRRRWPDRLHQCDRGLPYGLTKTRSRRRTRFASSRP